MGVRTNDDPETGGPAPREVAGRAGTGAGAPVAERSGSGGRPAEQDPSAPAEGPADPAGSEPGTAGGVRPSDDGTPTPDGDTEQREQPEQFEEREAERGREQPREHGGQQGKEQGKEQGGERVNGRARAGSAGSVGSAGASADAAAPSQGTSRRPPTLTTDTARPEGGGRAAPGDAPAPARQWPLLAVLALTGTGLLIIGLDPFAEAFRIGAILVGVALITGAVLRRTLPSVGMLAVRSRFTDMVTYAVLGGAITLLALMAQPNPWLELPFLKDLVEFTVR
ncbi:DUF3017 domain-containing protein [Streptomyces sp. NPDC005963]|uniref:DUF3017 domain-containing protein n=1 Tax=Streptomyces sp. NPDC005963 TaxID=3156721 RepID=UPI0033C5EC16